MNSKKKGISGSSLKLMAFIFMVIDHIAAYTLTEIPLFNNAYAVAFNTDISVVWLMRTVGRLAFPLCLILRSNWLKFSFYAFYPVHLLICGG